MLKRIPPERASQLIDAARRLPRSNPATGYPAWYLHRWHFLPEGYLSRRGAAGYDRGIRNLYNIGAERALIDKLVRRIAASTPDAVVELGCGPGRLLAALADSRVARRLVGVDLSPYLLERADRRLGERNVDLVHASGLAVPAEDGAFDTAVAVHYVGHLPEDQRACAVEEIARLVRPGGHVVIADHSWHRWPRHTPLALRHASWHASRMIRLQVFERIDVLEHGAPA